MSKQQIQALLDVLCAVDAFTEQATLTAAESDHIRGLQAELVKRV